MTQLSPQDWYFFSCLMFLYTPFKSWIAEQGEILLTKILNVLDMCSDVLVKVQVVPQQ